MKSRLVRRRGSGCDKFHPNALSRALSVKFQQTLAVSFGDAGVLSNLCARGDLAPVACEVLHYVATVTEAVHDVFEPAGMRQAEGVPAFVQTGEIDDGVAQQAVARS